MHRYKFTSLTGRLYKTIIEREMTRNNTKVHIPNLPLNVDQTGLLCSILKTNQYSNKDKTFLLNQLSNHIVPGVDETSKMKASLLEDICDGSLVTDIINKKEAVEMLGTMKGGYNVEVLVKLLENEELGHLAKEQLKHTILMFDYFNEVETKYKNGNPHAIDLMDSWARGEWFTCLPRVPDRIRLTVFKVPGEINTDDLSPAVDASTRPDIPLHSLAMLKSKRPGVSPDEEDKIGPLSTIEELKKVGNELVFVGDIVGTGSSRKSATNSILWHFGKDIPYVPNKRQGGYCFANKIAPIFFNTMEDSGALPIEMETSMMKTGDVINIHPHLQLTTNDNKQVLNKWNLDNPFLLDSVRAGGRINLIIGKSLTHKSQNITKKYDNSIFVSTNKQSKKDNSNIKEQYTLAQKIVGKACNLDGVKPGTYCEPLITSVGSQDTTGPMTRSELKDLACTGFSADLVMQSFCHTAAYPKPVDIATHQTLPSFINERGGISLKPGDGIIHSWLNRMILPDTVGTGGDSHTRFPIGISFPGGSGVVAFAAATGVMPLNMPESVLVKFKGTMQPGITLRDLVHSIPYFARKKGLLTIDKNNKKNVFNGKILEIEGLEHLTCEQAFELSDASAERSSAGCTIKLNPESIKTYLKSNIALLKWMIESGYEDKSTLQRRIHKMEEWIETPKLLEADKGAVYKAVLEINIDNIKEPLLCAPNDPDHVVSLSEVSQQEIDEVFIGSCMTNIGHFRACDLLLKNSKASPKSKLWISPPTKMDESQLRKEGCYDTFESKDNISLEIPGCSLCMGNQARVENNAWVVSTSTRNFPNRLGKGANVFLSSAELATVVSLEGKIPDHETYMKYYDSIDENKDKMYTYLDFSKM